MKPAAFTYHRVGSVAGALGLLRELGEDAKIIAGGQSLVAMMNFRLARPEHLIDIRRVPGLDQIRREGDCLRIGHWSPTTRWRPPSWGRSSTCCPGRCAGSGTCRSAPGGRWGAAWRTPTPPPMVPARGAAGRADRRGGAGRAPVGAAGDFFQGVFTTALEPDELIVEVVFPRPAPRAY